MNWSALLDPGRLGCPNVNAGDTAGRTEFERDFDRVLFCSAFRRLQSKTQVFPFPATAMIHTRMTHSLEASSVGRSLGTLVGSRLDMADVDARDIGAIVSAACLAHDIGNPPFSHSGEKAITEFFEGEKGQLFLDELDDDQKADFTRFDGNAMGFRILTYSNPKLTRATGGLGLTYPTLAAFTKYPCSASAAQATVKSVSRKKAGLLSSSVSSYREIAEKLQLAVKKSSVAWARHPLAFLTEAADDICYTIIDLEDGYRHGLVDHETTYRLLNTVALARMTSDDRKHLDNVLDERNRIGYLRSKAINSLVVQVVDMFMERHAEIINGEYESSITRGIESDEVLEEIRSISREQIYSDRTILQIEAAGFRVLPGLLNAFLSALKSPGKSSSDKVLSLIPKEYIWKFSENPYEAIMSITTYVAGMTDTFAVDLYRNLQGVQLPNY